MKNEVCRKKRLLSVVVLCAVFAVPHAFAQTEAAQIQRWYVGLEVGYAYNMLYSSAGYRAFTEYQDGHGFTIGIPVQYQFFDWLAVRTAFQYVQKNYALVRTELNAAIHSEWTNSYLELPLMAHFSFGGTKLRGFLNSGGYIGIWADSHIKGSARGLSENPFGDTLRTYESYDEKVPWDGTRDNRFEAGLLVGVGVQYALDFCTFYVEGRFNYGLTDMQKDYMLRQVPRVNDTLTIQVGVLFDAGIFSVFTGGKK
jgi:opacity protein-like surface antigen